MSDPELTRRNFVKGLAGAAFLASAIGAAAQPAFSDEDFDLDLNLSQGGIAAKDDDDFETMESCRPDSCAVSCGGTCGSCGGDSCGDTCGSSCPDTCRGTCVTCGGDSCNLSCQNACPTQRDSCGCPPPKPK